MVPHIFCVVLLCSPSLSRNVPRFSDLDEEDQHLFRAAYDTPSYDNEEYQEEEDFSLGKLDLLKNGMWAIKAKLKELKAFDKALAANMLSTKLKLKELIENHLLPLKKHKETIEKKKPYYNYQIPTYPPYEPQYNGPHYGPPPHGHDPYYGH
ncbi:hypothetical protein O3G_MSEX009003 [Manduca sexta]|uniref:Uncharacterized protein n=2 Tax=Manduca sexta TaxID=7130 RepID=A0A921ZBW5_MANSE|nr:hypothetical protein O3G_MSEX009003 [Manduca sexta]